MAERKWTQQLMLRTVLLKLRPLKRKIRPQTPLKRKRNVLILRKWPVLLVQKNVLKRFLASERDERLAFTSRDELDLASTSRKLREQEATIAQLQRKLAAKETCEYTSMTSMAAPMQGN